MIVIEYPVGYNPDRTPVAYEAAYTKDQILAAYQSLAYQQLPSNSIVQLSAIVDAMVTDLIRAVITQFPQKIGGKRTIPLEIILQASSLTEIHIRATDNLINDLSYQSPSDFAESILKFIAIDLRDCVAFHKYVEMKATRDIHIHNKGIANEIYIKKSGAHARVKKGQFIPIDQIYFLECYEACLQLSEWLEEKLHEKWYSSAFEQRRQVQAKRK